MGVSADNVVRAALSMVETIGVGLAHLDDTAMAAGAARMKADMLREFTPIVGTATASAIATRAIAAAVALARPAPLT